jgi:uncharacterized membrane protein
MRAMQAAPDRMGAFSDAVIAVVITIMVLELKAPASADPQKLLPLWPIALSYAVSYIFIAIIWMNHHHLSRFVRHASTPLLWLNFAHLFFVSLLPFATAWMAETHLAPAPVAAYAAIFVLVNLAYLAFERQVIRHADPHKFPEPARKMARRRSIATVAIFASAIVVAFALPKIAFAMICAALLLYLRPEPLGARTA